MLPDRIDCRNDRPLRVIALCLLILHLGGCPIDEFGARNKIEGEIHYSTATTGSKVQRFAYKTLERVNFDHDCIFVRSGLTYEACRDLAVANGCPIKTLVFSGSTCSAEECRRRIKYCEFSAASGAEVEPFILEVEACGEVSVLAPNANCGDEAEQQALRIQRQSFDIQRTQPPPSTTIFGIPVPQNLLNPQSIGVVDGQVVFGSDAPNAGAMFATIDAAGTITPVSVPCGNPSEVRDCQWRGVARDPRGNGVCAIQAGRTQNADGSLDVDKVVCRPLPGQSGTVLEVANLPNLGGYPNALAVAADGFVWYTDPLHDIVGRINHTTLRPQPLGIAPLGPQRAPSALVAGPYGAMWFTATLSGQIGYASTTTYGEIDLPDRDSQPAGIAIGPGNDVWFTLYARNRIGRIDARHRIFEYALPTADAGPVGITRGPDGAMWFTLSEIGKVGRICTDGGVGEISLPSSTGEPMGIVAGSANDLYVTERAGNRVTRIAITQPNSSPCDPIFAYGQEW